jgi:hypothetical protein
MALPYLTIINQPTTPNAAYTKLLFRVTGSSLYQPVTTYNKKYIADIYKNGSRIYRMEAPGETDFAVFDVSTIIQDSLEYDNNQKSNPDTMESETSNVLAEYQLKFGESISFTPSSSNFIFNGLPEDEGGALAAPALTSSVFTVFKGAVNPAINNSWNFPSSSFNSSSFTSENIGSTDYNKLRGPRLSNYPYGYEVPNSFTTPKPINKVDYETIGLLSQGFTGSYFQQASIEIYTQATASVPTYTASIYSAATLQNRLYALGVGPANLSASDATLAGYFSSTANPWTAYSIRVFYLNPGVKQYIADYWYVNDEQCNGYYDDGEQIIVPIPGYTGVWTTKANMLRGIEDTGGAGGANSAFSVGGATFYTGSTPDTGSSNYNTSFNSTTWSVGTSLPVNRVLNGTVGTITNILTIGGIDGSTPGTKQTTYNFNGTSWSSGPTLFDERSDHFSIAGTPSATLAWGGGSSTEKFTSIIFNGTTWSAGPALAGQWRDGAGAGSSTSAACGGADDGTGPSPNVNQKYNGTTWLSIAANNVAGDLSAGAGTSENAFTLFGGQPGPTTAINRTEMFNGSTWSTVANMNVARFRAMGAGTSILALAFGGFAGANSLVSSEQFQYESGPVQVGPIIEWIPNVNMNGVKTRFAFINQYGTWDYQTIYLPENKNTKFKERQTVDLPQVDYGNVSTNYLFSERGTTQYYSKTEDTIDIQTNWLTTEEAEWLKEMIESPRVFIQEFVGNQLDSIEFIPIVIINRDYISKTNPRGQKMFQFRIAYQFSNQRRARI